MAKALKTAALVVGVAALAVATYGAAIGPAAAGLAGSAGIGALSVTTATTALAAAAAATSLVANLAAKKPNATATSVSGNQERFSANKDQGIPYWVGRTQGSGWLIHRQTFDVPALATKDNAFQTLFAVWGGGGPYQQLEAFKVDGTTVTFGTEPTTAIEPTEATGTFHGNMFLQARLGAVPEATALHALDVAPFPTGWSAQSKLSGYASFAWTLRWDPEGKKFPSGVPQPSAILKGALTYDPRQDSTYPGGSGSCRALDETTYVYSENPALHALTWALGRWQNGKRVLGIGMALAAIDVPAFVQAANVADANEWTIGGVVYSTDGKLDVLKKMLAACSGQPLQLGGTLSCEVDTPRVSLATITDADIIGDASVVATPTISERINGVIPSCRLEDHDWSIVPCDKVQVDAYVATDGRTRTKAITWELVQDADQVAELATYAICNAREFGPIVTPLKLRWVGYKPGDCLTIQSSNMGMDSQTVVIRNRHLDPVTAAVTLTMRSETVEKHAFSLGQTTNPPPTPGLQVIDRGDLLKPGVDASWPNVRDTDPVDHPIPADGATNSADPTSPFGPNGTVADIIQGIDDLVETYGDTESAAASKVAAQAAAGAADLARQNSEAARDAAQGQRQGAETAAGAASTYRDQASTFAGTASTASGVATGKATEAGGYATAAGQQAQIATAKAGEAGGYVTAAQQAKLDAEQARSTAVTSAGAASASAATAGEKAAAAQASADLTASIGPGVINRNPNFVDWPDTSPEPRNWFGWNYAGGGVTRVAGINGQPYAEHFDAQANLNCGNYQPIEMPAGKYQVEVTADLTAGTWDGAGVIVAWYNQTGSTSTSIGGQGISFLTAPDTAGFVGAIGFRRTWTMEIDTGVNGSINRFNLHAMANYDGFATARSAKGITFRSLRIKPSSAAEGQVSSKASITQMNSVAASAESARAATETRLQSQLNGVATTLSQQAGTLVDLAGKASYYWQVVGTAPDGKTRIALTNVGGSGSFIVDAPNAFFTGNVFIDGSLYVNKLAYGATGSTSLFINWPVATWNRTDAWGSFGQCLLESKEGQPIKGLLTFCATSQEATQTRVKVRIRRDDNTIVASGAGGDGYLYQVSNGGTCITVPFFDNVTEGRSSTWYAEIIKADGTSASVAMDGIHMDVWEQSRSTLQHTTITLGASGGPGQGSGGGGNVNGGGGGLQTGNHDYNIA